MRMRSPTPPRRRGPSTRIPPIFGARLAPEAAAADTSEARIRRAARSRGARARTAGFDRRADPSGGARRERSPATRPQSGHDGASSRRQRRASRRRTRPRAPLGAAAGRASNERSPPSATGGLATPGAADRSPRPPPIDETRQAGAGPPGARTCESRARCGRSTGASTVATDTPRRAPQPRRRARKAADEADAPKAQTQDERRSQARRSQPIRTGRAFPKSRSSAEFAAALERQGTANREACIRGAASSSPRHSRHR